MSDYEAVIGLEIHAQLLTHSKMFCACPAAYGAAPNTNVCPVCLGLPGALPVPNERAVEFAVKAGLAMNCAFARKSLFARKSYFYPDCPKNYQITQYEAPLCTDGHLPVGDGERRVRIKRIHLEEDAGKLVHPGDDDASYVDMNRAGVPLIEIVTEPDMRSPVEASTFLKELRTILRYLDICDGNMEAGSLRCDANVSLREIGAAGLGVSTEIKNLNSFKFVEHALEFEIRRQRKLLRRGEAVEHVTLLWDDAKGRSLVMRTKEETHDYRYFPDPDLRPLEVPKALVERLRRALPELPGARNRRFVTEYGIPVFEATVLTGNRGLADYFESVARESGEPRAASHWIVGEVLHVLNDRGITVADLRVSVTHLSRLISLVSSGRINLPTAKDVFKRMAETGEDPDTIIGDGDLARITDEDVIAASIVRVLDTHSKEVGAYFGGKDRLFTYFVGEVMRLTRGRADPEMVNRLLKRALDSRRGG